MPLLGPRRSSHRPPPILDDGSSAVIHRRPILLQAVARTTALATARARFRQPAIGLVLLDDGSSAVSHRQPILVGLAAARRTAIATAVARFRQPVVPPFPISDGTDARTAPAVHLVGLAIAGPQAITIARLRHRQPVIPPFPISDGTDARTQPRPVVGLAVALVAAGARVRASYRPVWLPAPRRDPVIVVTDITRPTRPIGFPAATVAPVVARARYRQPAIGLVLLADGTDARTQPRPIVGLAVALTTATARVRSSYRPVRLPVPRREPATADTTISRPSIVVGLPAARAATATAIARFRQPYMSPFPTSDGTDARTRPRPMGGWLVGVTEAQRARVAARAAFRQPIRPPRIEDDGSSPRPRPGTLLGTAQANLVAELRARQWSLRLPVVRREPAAAVLTPGVVVTRTRLAQTVTTRTRLPREVVTRNRTI